MGTKWYLASVLFIPTFMLGLNGGIWQIKRRREKVKRIADFDNLDKPILEELPTAENPAGEYTRIKLVGSFDNEGSMLVGPRPKPDHMNRIGGESQRGGFLVMTPFEIAGTRQFVMVNRGWVPINACKSRLHLVQYIGEGFKPFTLSGIIRKEERLGKWLGGDAAENHAPIPGAMSWQVSRPFDMALYYFKRRFGPENIAERQYLHGARNYCIEMTEDMSGDDQVLINGNAYPHRRPKEEVQYVALLPIVHTMYSCFWFLVAGASLYGLRRSFLGHRLEVIKAKIAEREGKEAAERIAKSGDAYKEEVRKILKDKQDKQQ